MLILSSATVNNSKPLRLITAKADQVFLTPADDVVNTNSAELKDGQMKQIYLDAHNNKKSLKRTINDTVKKRDGKVFTSVEQVPEYPGGLTAFGAFLGANIKYPAEARKNKIQGRVIISFIVETDGSLSNVTLVRGIGYGADEEALRVIKLSPNWKPGTQNGTPVRVAYSVPIAFTLDDAKPQKENKTGAVNDGKKVSEVALTTATNPGGPDTGKMLTSIQLNAANGSASPVLYVVDGKQVSDISNLDANDIQSVNVLKGKNATDVYGQKGTNGVVVITTKRLKAGIKSN
jgi:TonB family protein